jgi:mono/diheme cytochrome c family protein
VAKLEPKFQEAIRTILVQECGTPSAPKLLGGSEASRRRLGLGAEVYARNCRQCHGVSGGGDGPSAKSMLPRPRNYRRGIFKFTSTEYGAKPLREDLVRTVRRGIAGTSMPSFHLLPPQELEAVVDYVLALTHRGELEEALADAAEFDGQVDPKAVPEMVKTVLGRWKEARTKVVYPVTPMPELTRAHAQKGKEAFLTKGCSKCHGDDGRGQTAENRGDDVWGFPTKAADLTSGMLRGGTEALDIYRHIDAGINGTPMPSFRGALAQEPETVWNLVAYVFELSNARRNGVIPEAGMLKPLPGVETNAAAPAAPKAALNTARPGGAGAQSSPKG